MKIQLVVRAEPFFIQVEKAIPYRVAKSRMSNVHVIFPVK